MTTKNSNLVKEGDKQFFKSQCCGAKAKWIGLLDMGDLYCTKCEKKCLVTLTKAGIDASVEGSMGLEYPDDDNQEWKELLHKSLRSMKLGFSGSQVEWIDDFIQSEKQKSYEDGKGEEK